MSSNMMQALKSLQGFSALSEAALDQIAPFATVRAVRAGETIFCQGEPSPYCFGVLNGEIVIQHVSKDSRFPPKVLGVLGPGTLFGESSIFEDKPRVAMATASTNGTLAVIRGSELREWMHQNTDEAQPLLMALLQTSFRRLQRTNQELAMVYGIGRILGSDKSFSEQLEAVLEFLKGSVEGLDDLVFYQRSLYWQEFSPVMSLPKLEELPAIPLQNELAQKVSMTGVMQSFDPQKIRAQMTMLQWPWENRVAISVIPLFDWEKASDPLQGLLVLSSSRKSDAFSAAEKLLLTSIAHPLAEALSRQSRREDALAQSRLRQSKETF
jgi:CRP-like cAMP-binding protein